MVGLHGAYRAGGLLGLERLASFALGPWTLIVFGWMAVLVIVRFLFGMGEAGAYPNITRALHNWFPLPERGFAQGSVWMSGPA